MSTMCLKGGENYDNYHPISHTSLLSGYFYMPLLNFKWKLQSPEKTQCLESLQNPNMTSGDNISAWYSLRL